MQRSAVTERALHRSIVIGAHLQNGSYHSAKGAPLVDTTRFPGGLRVLSDYGTAKGIGLGWSVS